MPDKNTEVVQEMYEANFLDGEKMNEGGANAFTTIGGLEIAKFFYVAGLKRSVELLPKVEKHDCEESRCCDYGHTPENEQSVKMYEILSAATQAITNEIKEREG